MTDTPTAPDTEISKQLRAAASMMRKYKAASFEVYKLDEAADLIDTLTRERDALEQQLKALGDAYHKRGNDIAYLRHQLKKAKKDS